jgi:hypothetical protein
VKQGLNHLDRAWSRRVTTSLESTIASLASVEDSDPRRRQVSREMAQERAIPDEKQIAMK